MIDDKKLESNLPGIKFYFSMLLDAVALNGVIFLG